MIQTVLKPNNRSLKFEPERLVAYIDSITVDYPRLNSDTLLDSVYTKLRAEEVDSSDITKAIYQSAVELISKDEPDWVFVAARAYATKLYKEAALNRGYKAYADKPYGSFLKLIQQLTAKGLYKSELAESYTVSDVCELGNAIDYTKDHLFTYIGLLTLAERYLTTDYDKSTLELPQERFMIISMHLMINEPADRRVELVKEAYWALSNLYMTVATPTMANAGKAKGGQLSSCFIDTIDDSLQGIYDSNTDVARLSKMGGGISLYAGKIRARGSDIRGYKGKSSGIVPWLKNLNNTATSVDQLGTRKGSIAVYLQDWHKDILAFLDLKLNNGDERMRAHDLFLGFVASDLFMEAVDERADWYLFDPHEIKTVMGFELDDFYDEEVGRGSFRDRYQQCVDNSNLSRVTVPAIDIMKRIMKSQLETGVPYMFYKDTVNRANPNKHAGIIYCSNLCTEIMENMSQTVVQDERLMTVGDETVIVTTKRPGDFVVCNLSSINLGKAVPDDVLERLIPIEIRMLDNVIDINNIEVLQAQYTNKRYRAIGLGTFGWHHLLALKGIRWESDESVEYADKLYEHINYLAIKSSMELAQEKGAYPLFKDSEWHTGDYFTSRGYTSDDWIRLGRDVSMFGMRNGYLFAVAPNGSTSIISGSTASIDPIYDLVSYEEKTTYKIANPSPDLSPKTIWYYKTAFNIDQHWSIKQAAARQRHIDQSQSFNLYVRPDIKAVDFLALHLDAWRSGLKSSYYVRSRAVEMDECEVCT